jgi:hypothetical protein
VLCSIKKPTKQNSLFCKKKKIVLLLFGDFNNDQKMVLLFPNAESGHKTGSLRYQL